MADAVLADVVVVNKAELSVGSELFDQLGRGLDVVGGSADREGVRGLDLADLGVATKTGDGVLAHVNTALAQGRISVGSAALRVGADSREATKAKDHGVLHLGGEEERRDEKQRGSDADSFPIENQRRASTPLYSSASRQRAHCLVVIEAGLAVRQAERREAPPAGHAGKRAACES